jgi:hypothetical protein
MREDQKFVQNLCQVLYRLQELGTNRKAIINLREAGCQEVDWICHAVGCPVVLTCGRFDRPAGGTTSSINFCSHIPEDNIFAWQDSWRLRHCVCPVERAAHQLTCV